MTELIGIFMTISLGGLSFFLMRFIKKHDKFEETTRLTLQSVATQSFLIEGTLKTMKESIKEYGMDPTKGTLKRLSVQIQMLKSDMDDVKPNAHKPDENYGRILVLEQKILTMFKTVEILVEKQQMRHPK